MAGTSALLLPLPTSASASRRRTIVSARGDRCSKLLLLSARRDQRHWRTPTNWRVRSIQNPGPPALSSCTLSHAPRRSREIVFLSGIRKRKNVSQPCFTTRNLRTKLCGIRSQTEEPEFVDPFKSWYLETLSISEMENRLASAGPRLGGRSELKSGKFCTVLLGTHFYAF